MDIVMYIDKDRLMKALKTRGLTCKEASRLLGRSENYISSAMFDGSLPEHAVRSISAILHIEPEEYAASALGDEKMADSGDIKAIADTLTSIASDLRKIVDALT